MRTACQLRLPSTQSTRPQSLRLPRNFSSNNNNSNSNNARAGITEEKPLVTHSPHPPVFVHADSSRHAGHINGPPPGKPAVRHSTSHPQELVHAHTSRHAGLLLLQRSSSGKTYLHADTSRHAGLLLLQRSSSGETYSQTFHVATTGASACRHLTSCHVDQQSSRPKN